MAISPPGDILLDVANAADPRHVEAARARLKAHAAAPAAAAFEVPAPPRPTDRDGAARMPEHFVQFESMVLQSFLQTMLPEDTASVYGEGLAGEMWRGLLAQEVGNQMARRGGIGIAERVLGEHYLEDGKKIPVAGVPTAAGEEAADQARLASGLVREMERQAAQTIAAGAGPKTTNSK